MADPILIGGEWKAGRGGVVTSIYPADGSVSGEVEGASPEDVDLAVAAGAKADWRDGRFATIEGEDDFIPLPEN